MANVNEPQNKDSNNPGSTKAPEGLKRTLSEPVWMEVEIRIQKQSVFARIPEARESELSEWTNGSSSLIIEAVVEDGFGRTSYAKSIFGKDLGPEAVIYYRP